MNAFALADVFSGAGGLTLGFRESGFEPLLAVERHEDFAATYAENFGTHVIVGAVEDVLKKGLPRRSIDVLVGGPPCQGFSSLTGNRASDPRRRLWEDYMAVLEGLDATVFVLENVPNFLRSEEGSRLIERASSLGYVVEDDTAAILNAADYGVPQSRKRAVVVGSRIGKIRLPEPTTIRRSVRDAFMLGCWTNDSRIPPEPFGVELGRGPLTGPELHLGRNPTAVSRARYRAVPPGGNRFDLARKRPDLTPECWRRKKSGSTDVFGRLRWERPSVTIRTEFFKPEKGRYLHPAEDRPITHWEALRLQSFPDSFRWCGSKIAIAAQIGNAVPPLLAKALAREIEEVLRRSRRWQDASVRRRRGAA